VGVSCLKRWWQYGDLADIVKMLNMEGGGSFNENVNEAQKLVDEP
jgi:hypothetical protein